MNKLTRKRRNLLKIRSSNMIARLGFTYSMTKISNEGLKSVDGILLNLLEYQIEAVKKVHSKKFEYSGNEQIQMAPCGDDFVKDIRTIKIKHFLTIKPHRLKRRIKLTK